MGQFASVYRQSWPPASKFTIDDIPDLTGKVVIVTGGNSGIGKETAKALLMRNAKVYLAARSEQNAMQAISELLQETGKEAVFLKLDLSSLTSIKDAAEEFQRKEKALHVLFNNAGVFLPVEEVTADGYDFQFGINVLGHHYFTKLLLPTLLSTAKNSSDKKVRVVTTSSLTHEGGKLDFNAFKDGPARKKTSLRALYDQSKGNVVQALELARRYGDEGIVSISLNLGNIRTDVQRNLSPAFRAVLNLLILYPAAMGALTQLYAGTSHEAANFNGKYLIPWAQVGSAIPETQVPETGRQLWIWLEEQVKNYEEM
ncbi:hypothetical protein AX16_001195 [Volvariella volvacea WC 439]|nr:hypothetical protein AX16_001195 [Volvariella volvacea WC 439]